MKPVLFAVLLSALPAQVWSADSRTERAYETMQSEFALAYNRKDVEAMSLAFAQDAIRVTPSGVYKGRDAIRRNFQEAIDLGLHDYSVQRTGSRSYGDLIFNVGEWNARLGDQPFHGYYTAIVGREGDQIKILEETVTVAAPGK